MSKISESMSGESSTTSRTSVWGLKYVPGRLTRSSSSKRRGSAMRGVVSPELAQLPGDFGLHVQRLLAHADAALVAGDHEIAHLGHQRGVGVERRRLPHERRELGLDVQWLLAPAHPALVAGLEHLADLVVANRAGHRLGLGRLVEREPAAPDLRVGLGADGERDHGHDRGGDHDDEQHDPERVLHRRTVWPMWRRLRRRTFAPRRPVVFPDQWGLVLVTAIVVVGGVALVAYV